MLNKPKETRNMKQRWKEKNVLKRANFKMMKKLWSSKCWFSIHSYFSHSAKSRTKVGRKKYSLREGSKHEDFALREALAEIVNTTDFMKGYRIFWNFIYIEKGFSNYLLWRLPSLTSSCYSLSFGLVSQWKLGQRRQKWYKNWE